jgi:prepilin-type N-terminal cleavage/methylation domain-containing protein/prepilin-type processing-associated H-X9-DG protein
MKRGFTLVEVLVVIAIVLLLVAMVLPVARSVRAAAKRAVCASNMRQLYTGFALYAHDNRSSIPYVDASANPVGMRGGQVDWIGYWVGVKDMPKGGTLWPYMNEVKVYKCPEDTGWRGDWHIWTPKPGVHSYSVPVPRECKLLNTAETIKALLVDESQATINDGGFTTTWDSLSSRHRLSGWAKQTRAGAGGNILFCDGRVQFYLSSGIVVAEDPMFK